MTSEPKKYRSRAAAERARARVYRDVPGCRVEVRSDNALTVWVHLAALSPKQAAVVEEHDLRAPAPPNPAKPLLPPFKRPKVQNRSTIENAWQVCCEVFDRYRAEGRFLDRGEILAELLALGVTENTAKTYYTRYRTINKLPRLYTNRTAVDRRVSPVRLSATNRPLASGARVRNGVAEPATGSLRREVWDMADLLYRRLGRSPVHGEVSARLTIPSRDTIKNAMATWRRFHGRKPAAKKKG